VIGWYFHATGEVWDALEMALRLTAELRAQIEIDSQLPEILCT
jgi:hypothetical protein